MKEFKLASVEKCVTIMLHGYPDILGNQDILRAAVGQLWRGRTTI